MSALSQPAARPGFLRRLFGRGDIDTAAFALYNALVAQARTPDFYARAGVADSVDGRFDLIVLHCVLALRRLQAASPPRAALAQRLQEVMFSDLDQALREMGVGDLSVGKKIKQMADAFAGRLRAYDEALGCCDVALAEAIARNVYRGQPPRPEAAADLAAYVRAQAAHLAAQPDAALDRGEADFLPFQVPA